MGGLVLRVQSFHFHEELVFLLLESEVAFTHLDILLDWDENSEKLDLEPVVRQSISR